MLKPLSFFTLIAGSTLTCYGHESRSPLTALAGLSINVLGIMMYAFSEVLAKKEKQENDAQIALVSSHWNNLTPDTQAAATLAYPNAGFPAPTQQNLPTALITATKSNHSCAAPAA